jgi:hypothetical protein
VRTDRTRRERDLTFVVEVLTAEQDHALRTQQTLQLDRELGRDVRREVDVVHLDPGRCELGHGHDARLGVWCRSTLARTSSLSSSMRRPSPSRW